eukprot:SM000426S15720  [mRNA]  locus=s426:9334:10934:- [translate_table: standard]
MVPSGGGGAGGLLSGFTRLSKALAALLALGYALSLLAPPAVDYLALVPANLVVDVLALLFVGRLVEPIWGSKEFLRFIVVVNTALAAATFATMIALFYATYSENFLYARISGFHGVVAGLLVAVKQLMPDQEITAFFVFKFRAKWVPSLVAVISIVTCAVVGDVVLGLPFILYGMYGSWLYLRYFQPKSDGALKGDPNEEFAFVTFFPEFCWPVIRPIANAAEAVFCGRRLAAAAADQGDDVASKPLPGSDPVEASRRRERGARALEERLAVVDVKAAGKEPTEEKSPASLPLSSVPSGVESV